MVLYLADLSNWQEGISIEQVIAEGFAAVICKASEGTTFTDAQFHQWIPRIQSAGAIPGAYHFLRAGNGAAQARFFHGKVSLHGGPTGFICALDNEEDASLSDTREFVAEWNRISGGHPLVMYTGAWWWDPRGWNGAELTPYLWHSHYVNRNPDLASNLYMSVPDAWWTPGYGGWDRATILQFSSGGMVAGRRIDVNAFQGTSNQLRELAQAPTQKESPMTYVANEGATYVLTDGHSVHRALPWSGVNGMEHYADALPIVSGVGPDEIARIMSLPTLAQIEADRVSVRSLPIEVSTLADRVSDLADTVDALVGQLPATAIDYDQLAAALVRHFSSAAPNRA